MGISLYLLIQLVISAITIFIGYRLIFGLMPEELKGTPYEHSRKIMGAAMVLSPIIFIVYYFAGTSDFEGVYSNAIDLMGYYPTSALVNISLLILIGEKIDIKSTPFKIYLLSFLLYPIYIVLGFIYLGADRIIVSANTLLFASIAGQFIYFYFRYRDVEKRVNKEYAYDISVHMKWIRQILFMMIGVALIASTASIYLLIPLWVRLLFSLYILAIYIHIYESYYRFIIAYHIRNLEIIGKNRVNNIIKAESAENDEPLPKFNFNSAVFQQIEIELARWVDSYGYNKRGTTIELVSEELHTNRTYLSAYINSVHKCSFKAWITNLRVEHAKLLLLDTHNNYTLTEIANKIGFSSQSSFVHVFSHTVGMTPSKWKEEEVLKKKRR